MHVRVYIYVRVLESEGSPPECILYAIVNPLPILTWTSSGARIAVHSDHQLQVILPSLPLS